ncbi:putative GIM3-Gim complex component [Gigaspora margarita]|uniref:Prefoldin subunit 4 n=1 Tax=Gigaspora margarita TaxID=4874 RepID=A0A8H4ERD6_GIGMA|nr:putative GIM3-Gim complex component [Gigaspora margarita]
MRMINQDEEVEAEVTWEDQQNINSFSKLNVKFSDIEERYGEKKQEDEYLDDLLQELEQQELLGDEGELVRYKIGDAFISITLEDAVQRTKREKEFLSEELKKLRNGMDSLTTEMEKLKVLLYGKFGKAINLEKD